VATTRIDRIDRRTRPWRARYLGADSHRYSRTFARKADAEVWLAAQLAARDRGEGFDPNAGKVALGEWWEEFVEALPPDRAPATVARYASLWRTHIAPSFATTPLNRITVAAVQRWLNDIERHRSPDTARQARQLLSAMLRLAVTRGRLARNPVDLVRSPRTTPRRQLILDPSEVEALAAAADEHRPGSGDLVRFLAASGLRFGEAVALRAGAVDVDSGAVTVERSASESTGRLVEGPTKSRRRRVVYVGPLMAARLRPLVAGRDPDAHVFTAPRGGLTRYNAFRKAVWNPARRVLPAAKRDVTPHDLRDSYAVNAIRAGADLIEVSTALGHSTPAVTASAYTQAFDAQRAQRRAAELEAASNVTPLRVVT
jgi:integrase